MRIKLSKQDSDIIDQMTNLFSFKYDGIIARIAFAFSIQLGKKFSLDEIHYTADGKDWRDERSLFGTSSDEKSYYVIYRAILDQHYNRNLSDEEFSKLCKSHLSHGLSKINYEINELNITSGEHIHYLMNIVSKGITFINNDLPFNEINENLKEMEAYDKLIKLTLGADLINGSKVTLSINDLNEFDSCNIAIAGMVGSGKTQLVKDLLFQISEQSNKELKFIFFDYKGEGNADGLKQFLNDTYCKMVDLKKEPFNLNPLSFINLFDNRSRTFNIKSFVDYVCTIATQLGANQKHILQTVISNTFEEKLNLAKQFNESISPTHPTLADINEALKNYNSVNGRNPDTLDAIIQDLSESIFSIEPISPDLPKIFEQNLYINLPIELSDTLRQLCVFLTLKYLLAEFSSSNDTEPTKDRIKPLRYVIVVDEAHVYLKNKNASKALEEMLRILRSKGVVIIMLTQGVEDFKTKNFDFSSQIKIPICLNVNNKDYKLIESFLGTPRSKQKMQEVINSLKPQVGVINLSEPIAVNINQYWKRNIN